MQTTENTGLNHVDRLKGESFSGGDGDGGIQAIDVPPKGHSVDNGAALSQLNTLVDLLNNHAEQLDIERARHEHDPTEEMQEEVKKMESGAQGMRNAALQLGQEIREIQKNPQRKVSRQQVEIYTIAATTAMRIGDTDKGEVEAVEHVATGHKVHVHEQVVAKAHVAEKKAAPNAKKPAVKPVAKPAVVHVKPDAQPTPNIHGHAPEAEEDRPWVIEKAKSFCVKAKEKVTHAAHTVWHSVTETAEDVGEAVQSGVMRVKHFASHAIDVVKHAAPVVAVVNISGKVAHAVMHPVETGARIFGKLKTAKTMLLAALPSFHLFGHDEDEAPKLLEAAAASAAGLSGQAMAAVSKLTLPVFAAEKVEHGTWLAPLAPAARPLTLNGMLSAA